MILSQHQGKKEVIEGREGLHELNPSEVSFMQIDFKFWNNLINISVTPAVPPHKPLES